MIPDNSQAIFTEIKRHFIDAKNPPAFDEYSCKYRMYRVGEPPLKCAAGILIPDDQFAPSMECGALNIGEKHSIIDLWFLANYPLNIDFIAALQRAHDGCAQQSINNFHVLFEDRLKLIARNFDLIWE